MIVNIVLLIYFLRTKNAIKIRVGIQRKMNNSLGIDIIETETETEIKINYILC